VAAAAREFGADETAFTRASAVKPNVFAAGVVDLHRLKLIDIVAGRSRKVLTDCLFDPDFYHCRGFGGGVGL
jgi:transposase